MTAACNSALSQKVDEMRRTVHKVKKHPLLGIWSHAYSLAKWMVSISKGKLTVDGVDSSTWDKFVIPKLSWTKTTLKFTSHYPSTGRTVSHRCTALSDERMKVLLCYEVTEIWTRSTPRTTSERYRSGRTAQLKRSWLVGNWHNPEGDDPRVVCAISINNHRWGIHAEDVGDGERLRVTDVQWNGRALSFRTRMPSTGQICWRILKPISQNKLQVVLQFKEPEVWEKLGSCEKAVSK